MKQRRIKIYSRHGQAEQNPDGSGSYDRLETQGIPAIATTGDNLIELIDGANPKNTIISSAPTIRARQTILIEAAHALKLVDKPIATLDDLENVDWNGYQIREDTNLKVPTVHTGVYKREGFPGVFKYWIANPNVSSQTAPNAKGEENSTQSITSYQTTAREGLLSIRDFLQGNNDVEFAGSHTGKLEPTLFELVYAGEKSVPDHVDDIGGPFKFNETFALIIDGSKAYVQRGDYRKDINLQAALSKIN